MRQLALFGACLLAGCATYSPEPTLVEDGVLAATDASVLEQRASAIERPFLRPVTVDLSAPLDGNAVAALTVVNNPDLIAQRAQLGVATAQSFAAGLLPDPTFSGGVSKVLSGPDTLFDLSGAFGFDLNALRTRAVRREQAIAQEQQVSLDLAWAEWQAAGQARLQAVRVGHLQAIAGLALSSRDVARSQLERITQAAARGDVAGDRMQAARLALASAEESLRTSRQDLATARTELSHLLGLPPDYPLQLAKAEPPSPPPPADALFKLASANRTDLEALRQGYAAQEAAVHQAVLDQFPNLSLTLNGQRDSAGNFLAGPAVDLTLPLWNRNRGGIAVERATREALRTEYDARLFQTRADIAEAEAGIALAIERRDQALSYLPRLEQFAVASRRAADRGDLSLETAENAEQALRDKQMQLVQARQDYSEQMIALELLTGTLREAWPQ